MDGIVLFLGWEAIGGGVLMCQMWVYPRMEISRGQIIDNILLAA
jgi:hypothetical protein